MAAVQRFFARMLEDPGPLEEIGIGGFTMLVRTRERIDRRATAATSVVEDGSFVNDHIILQPLRVRIEGNVSDVHVRQTVLSETYQRALTEIGNVTQFAPAVTQAQASHMAALVNDAADAVRRANAFLEAGGQAIRYFGNQDSSAKTIREQFCADMEALFDGRQMITIDMPYKAYRNMVITSLNIESDNNTDDLSFTMEAQQVRLVELIYSQLPNAAPGTGGQTQGPSNKGAQEGTPVQRSFISFLLGGR